MARLDDIRAAIDSFRELLEHAGQMGMDADLIERNATHLPHLLLELAQHRRHAFDPRRAASIDMAERLWKARESMRRNHWTAREINTALRERFGFSRSRRNALLREAEAACVLPGHIAVTLGAVKPTQRGPESETDDEPG